MSLSDCPECWQTPCECGYEYRNMSPENRAKLASVILGREVSAHEPKETIEVSEEFTRDDYNHLAWIYGRLMEHHNENANYDYMIKFVDILKKLSPKCK